MDNEYSSSRADIRRLTSPASRRWMRLLFEMLIWLAPLAEAPKERELSTDLYVLY